MPIVKVNRQFQDIRYIRYNLHTNAKLIEKSQIDTKL